MKALLVLTVLLSAAPRAYGATAAELPVPTWTASVRTFFQSSEPEIASLSGVLPALAALDREDPAVRAQIAPLEEAIRAAAAAATAQAAAPGDRALPSASRAASARKLALLDTAFAGWLPQEQRALVREAAARQREQLSRRRRVKLQADMDRIAEALSTQPSIDETSEETMPLPRGGHRLMPSAPSAAKKMPAPKIPPVAHVRDFSSILVLVAMDVEKTAILSDFAMKRVSKKLPLGLEAYVLDRARGPRIYLASTGVGLANAAVAAAMLAHKLSVDGILLLGVGGSLSSNLEIGDTVIGARMVQHDSRYSSGSGYELMRPGEPHLSVPAEQRPSPFMAASGVWLDWLAKATEGTRSFQGTLLSGSEFVGDPKRKAELARISDDALLVDMEASGVAQIARKLSIPFGVAKTVSDRLNPDGSIATDYGQFLRRAAEVSKRIFDRLVADTSGAARRP